MSRPSRSNASPKVIIVYSAGLYIILPGRLKFSRLTKSSHERLSVFLGRISNEESHLRGITYIQFERLDHKYFLRDGWKSHSSRSNALPEGLIVSSVRLYTIMLGRLRFSSLTKSSPEGLSVLSDVTSNQELCLSGAIDKDLIASLSRGSNRGITREVNSLFYLKDLVTRNYD